MGANLPRRRMSSVQKAEEEVAAAVDAAVAALPTIEKEAAARTAVDKIMAKVERAPGGREERRPATGRRRRPPQSPAATVVRLDGLEVTQEVQDLPHSVPLVANKATLVRAYLSRPGSAVTVRGELKVARTPFGPWRRVPSLGTALLAPSRAGSTLADLRSRRADLRYSLNFWLPAELVDTAGALYVRLGTLRRAKGMAAVPSVAHVRRHRFTLSAGVPMRLRLVLLPYVMGGVTHTPSATDVAHLRSYLGRAYPVEQVQMMTTTVPAAPAPPFTAAQVNAQLAAIRAVDVATGTDARTHYYGMVSDGGFFMRGQAAGIPGTPQPETVASGPTGATGFAWDTDGSWGDWYGAHELGHTLGRLHAEFCGAGGGGPYPFDNGQLSNSDEAFVGLDAGDGVLGLPLRVMNPITSHDVMSYCDDQWLSSFTYSGIYDRLIAEDALAAGATPSGAMPMGAGRRAGGRSLSMRLFAAVNLDRTEGTISAVLPTSLVGPAPEAAAGAEQAGRVRAQVLDSDGDVIADTPVPFVRSSCEDPDEDLTGTVDAELPDGQGATHVRLLVDDAVVAEYDVGGAAARPSSPRAGSGGADRGAPDEGGRTARLTWDAAGAPASQRYVVQVSQQEGVWETVAVGIAEPEFDLPLDHIDADEVSVRILATTGMGVVEVETERIAVR